MESPKNNKGGAPEKKGESFDHDIEPGTFHSESENLNNPDIKPGSFHDESEYLIDEDIEPGTFHPVSDEDGLNPESELKLSETSSVPDLVAKYSLFKEVLNPKDDVIYYPCASHDVSPSVAFPDSRVIYVDIDQESVDALQRGGFEVHNDSALEYDPGDVDILIMLNPQIPPEIPSSHVVEGGFVLSNNYHGTASLINKDEEYKLNALIKTSQEGELILDTEDLEKCWEEIDTEEGFQNAPFIWNTASYSEALPVVEAVTGKKENVLAEYKKILEISKEQLRQQNAEMLEKDPGMAEFIKDVDSVHTITFSHEGEQFVLPTHIPKKKGGSSDIFVFQKSKTESA